ncbi:MAG: fumarylacetoacetate hydrolase family protein [Deltaproteobacteria bacterium]|nr:fumarylacetoacetate hydrolase family protein [Deltaproteobacteria bacterium]
MGDSEATRQAWYEDLLRAHAGGPPADSPAARHGALNLEEAYAVQARLVDHKVRSGERVIGWKVGATSRRVMNQLEIKEPIFGCMTSGGVVCDPAEVRASGFQRLAVEGEIAVVMKQDLSGPGVTTADVVSAAAGIMAAVELVDCRIAGWSPTVEEAVADNAFHAGVVLGPYIKPLHGYDPALEGVIMRKNGMLLASACGVEAMGSPLHVVSWLADHLARFDRQIEKGDIILTGSLTEFFHVSAGDVLEISYSTLGSIRFPVAE